MGKKIIIFLTLAVLMLSFTAVFADQNGNDRWCNTDEYGCWVTGENGDKCYIMFWSEASRKFFMGDKTAPYTNVVSMAEGARLGLICGVPDPVIAPKTIESICRAWVDEIFEDLKADTIDKGYHIPDKEEVVSACMGSYKSVEETEDAYNNRNSSTEVEK